MWYNECNRTGASEQRDVLRITNAAGVVVFGWGYNSVCDGPEKENGGFLFHEFNKNAIWRWSSNVCFMVVAWYFGDFFK